jgi:hypothetical protein
MSMNIPFTPVEGAVALPSLRPLGPISQSLCREWALLPPNVSLRVELKVLYAAMLRSFCLSSQAIRSMCKWEQHKVPAVDTASQAVSATATAGVAAIGMPAARPATRAPHGTSNLRLAAPWPSVARRCLRGSCSIIRIVSTRAALRRL